MMRGRLARARGYGHPLRLASRQLGRECALAPADLQVVEELRSARSRVGDFVAGQLQHEGDVVGRVEERQQVVELEDETDLFQSQAPQIVPQPLPVVDDVTVEAHAPA
jgi:hypothetical protein